MAWHHLGTVGGGTVGGMLYDSKHWYNTWHNKSPPHTQSVPIVVLWQFAAGIQTYWDDARSDAEILGEANTLFLKRE